MFVLLWKGAQMVLGTSKGLSNTLSVCYIHHIFLFDGRATILPLTVTLQEMLCLSDPPTTAEHSLTPLHILLCFSKLGAC